MTPERARTATALSDLVHDLNNLIALILGHAQEIEEFAEPGGDIHESAIAIARAAGHAAELTRRIAGTAPAARSPVDLHSIVTEVVVMFSQRGLRVESILRAETPVVEGDATILAQMLINLAANARDAMIEGGVLTFETSGVRESVEIVVRDTGPGIPPEHRDRIFLPGWSTKTGRSGAGMGLAIVRHAVDYHGGAIHVESDTGGGAAFHIRLPLQAHCTGE